MYASCKATFSTSRLPKNHRSAQQLCYSSGPSLRENTNVKGTAKALRCFHHTEGHDAVAFLIFAPALCFVDPSWAPNNNRKKPLFDQCFKSHESKSTTHQTIKIHHTYYSTPPEIALLPQNDTQTKNNTHILLDL